MSSSSLGPSLISWSPLDATMEFIGILGVDDSRQVAKIYTALENISSSISKVLCLSSLQIAGHAHYPDCTPTTSKRVFSNAVPTVCANFLMHDSNTLGITNCEVF